MYTVTSAVAFLTFLGECICGSLLLAFEGSLAELPLVGVNFRIGSDTAREQCGKGYKALVDSS